MDLQNLTQQQKIITGSIAGVLILVLGGRLVAQGVDVIAPDNLAGYFTLTINPNPNATPGQLQNDIAFGMNPMSLSRDHTYRFGTLRGEWRHFGDTVTLIPTNNAKAFETTSMGDTLSVMTKSIDLKIGKDGKTLTALNGAKGPIAFTKTGDAM